MKKVIPVLFVALVIMAGCKKKTEDLPQDPPASGCDIVTITGDITTPTTWYKNKVYVIDVNTPSVTAALTIEAGTVIKFARYGYGMNTLSGGSITAIGTAADPIIFTSYKDDSYSGDCNGDGNASSPAKGDWGGIGLKSNAVSNFQYCKFLYAGGNDINGALSNSAVGDTKNTSNFHYCTFAHTSAQDSLTQGEYGALRFAGSGVGYTCSNNTFYDNGVPVFVLHGADAEPVDNSNIFYNPANPSERNRYECVYLNNTDISGSLHLSVTGVPYFFDGISSADIYTTGSLSIDNNVILKFGKGIQFYYYNSSTLSGQQGSGVLFTSAKDDTGGDTNGDGSLTSPGTGDWDGVRNASTNIWQTWSDIHYSAH